MCIRGDVVVVPHPKAVCQSLSAQLGQAWSVLGGGEIFIAAEGAELAVADLVKCGIIKGTGLIVDCATTGCSAALGQDGRPTMLHPQSGGLG